MLTAAAAGVLSAQDYGAWRDYGGTSDSSQYSALRQVNKSNVSKLKVAWTYSTGDNTMYAFSPIVVDGVMFGFAKNNSIVALDARTGKEIWTHAPKPRDPRALTKRGINYWESKDRSDR